jgi:hypothetical protein
MDMHYRNNFGFSDDEVEDMISEVRIDKNAENEEPEEDILEETTRAELAALRALARQLGEAMEKRRRDCRNCQGVGYALFNLDDPEGGGGPCPYCADLRSALAAFDKAKKEGLL